MLQVLQHKPILKVLLTGLDLPTIIRLTATCKYLYTDWIPILEEVVKMNVEINKYYWGHHNHASLITLRKSVFETMSIPNPVTGCFKCVRCRMNEFNARLVNRKLHSHPICYMCYIGCKERRYILYSHARLFLDTSRCSKRLFDEWFDKVSVPLFENSGNDYAKIDYWVVNKDLVIQTYTRNNTSSSRRKRKKC